MTLTTLLCSGMSKEQWRKLKEAEKNKEAARLWISGLEAVNRKLGLARVIDLSATPFFLRGSGYAEGTLFPWTMSDFSPMDAIECGIVKLPRVPVADNIPGGDMPKFRNLWQHIRTRMPKKGRGKAKTLDPLSLPVELQTGMPRATLTEIAQYKVSIDQAVPLEGGGVRLVTGLCTPKPEEVTS